VEEENREKSGSKRNRETEQVEKNRREKKRFLIEKLYSLRVPKTAIPVPFWRSDLSFSRGPGASMDSPFEFFAFKILSTYGLSQRICCCGKE
jgi:hypothetical protein